MILSATTLGEYSRRSNWRTFGRIALVATGAWSLAASAPAAQVAVTFTNFGPENGIWFVSPWVAFHDGTFDLFDVGAAASPGIEALAEDGNTGPIDAAFAAAMPEGISATLGGPTAPGKSQTYVFDLDPMNPNHRYMSYLFMLIPSNDAWVGNAEPTTVQIFDSAGNFIAPSFTVPGSDVLDAGTEINDEVPENTAFLAQATPDTGVDENGVIGIHSGFMMAGSGGILDASTDFGGTTSFFSAGDFTAAGYNMARVTISQVNNASTASKLLNVSTRAVAGSGADTQIAGFVVSSGDEKRVLIRAVGPGLTGFGVDGALENPSLSVYDADGMLMGSNDDWETQDGGASALTDVTDAIASTGAFGLAAGSADAALVLTLPPGNYTAHVVTDGTATGVALVEVYEIQD